MKTLFKLPLPDGSLTINQPIKQENLVQMIICINLRSFQYCELMMLTILITYISCCNGICCHVTPCHNISIIAARLLFEHFFLYFVPVHDLLDIVSILITGNSPASILFLCASVLLFAIGIFFTSVSFDLGSIP